ncbi:MAG TPA: lysine--tRNA ligase, partial [Rhodanobacteraceae bacterium]|nr:lysine--tRNA ligase [Rhodanobacteraceae bacterium]
MNEIEAPSSLDENKLIAERREKLRVLRQQGSAFPNDFRPDACAGDLQRDTDGVDADGLATQARRVKIAGRLLGKRVMGKAS